jgi:hypothetical protein
VTSGGGGPNASVPPTCSGSTSARSESMSFRSSAFERMRL